MCLIFIHNANATIIQKIILKLFGNEYPKNNAEIKTIANKNDLTKKRIKSTEKSIDNNIIQTYGFLELVLKNNNINKRTIAHIQG